MKRINFLTLILLLPIVANAAILVDGIYYYLNGIEATVTYNGEIYNHNTYSGSVTIPESISYDGYVYNVTSIGEAAFYSCKDLVSISIPNSVKSIGRVAFYNCLGLKTVTIPNSVITIGNAAFGDCQNIEYLTISNSITTINENAFSWCTSLKNLEIPNSVVNIGKGAFGSLKSIKSLQIPNSVKKIGQSAFAGCSSLESVVIPYSVTQMDSYVFANCKSMMSISVESGNLYYDSRDNCNAIIESSTNKLITGCRNTIIPNSVTAIGEGAFSEIGSFDNPNFVFSESLRIIDNSAFYSTYPNSICFLGDIDRIGTRAFHNYEFAGSLSFLAFYGNINNPIASNAFWHGWHYTSEGQRYINKIIIGPNVERIQGMNVKPGADIYSYNPTPPEADENTFLTYNSTVHVPVSSLAAYFTAPYWSNFENIVGDAVEPESITINKDSLTIQIGDGVFNLSATVTPSNATPNSVIWFSSNPRIATVNNGKVTAIAAGDCDIIARCLNKQAICHVVVNDTTVAIMLDQQEAIVLPNHIITLTPSASPIMPALAVTSSDPSVAAARVVNNKIQVVGIKEGTTTITVGSVDGTAIPATCLVTVYTEPGDLDCDGFVNISDVTSLIDYLLSGDDSQISTKNADVNGDESINISDVTELIDILLSGNG